jgi:hypothetical protein
VSSHPEDNKPTLGYQSSRDRDADSKVEAPSRPSAAEIESRLAAIVYVFTGPGSPSPAKGPDDTPRSEPPVQNSKPVQSVSHGHDVNHAARVEPTVVISAPRQTQLEIVVPENIEAATTTEEANTKTAPETKTPIDEVASQPVTPAGDTVSAQPLGAAGAPVEKLSEEILKDESHPIKPVAEGEAIDMTSAAVAAFWAAVEILPVMPIAASQAGFSEELAEVVRVNFESFTEAVDTLLDTLSSQFDLSGPGRTRDLIFASSAALLAALACEKVRRRQQRLDDENLASMGFDADGYLLLAEGL